MIVVGTSAGREAWATDTLASLAGTGPVLVASAYAYELGKLRWVLEHTTVDRFFFLQDSVIVHDPAFLTDALGRSGAVALCADPAPYGMFMGAYDRHLLEQVGLPEVTGKRHSIELELAWTRAYCDAAGSVEVLFPDLADRNASGIVERHGRPNLVLANDHLTKFKGTWS